MNKITVLCFWQVQLIVFVVRQPLTSILRSLFPGLSCDINHRTISGCLLSFSNNLLSLLLCSGVHQQRVNPESLLLEAVKQVKVSDLEDDILELPEDDPAAANNQSVAKYKNTESIVFV